MTEEITVSGSGDFHVTRKHVSQKGQLRLQFKKNGWCFLLISLGCILRGLFYIPGLSKTIPGGLEYVIGNSPLMFGVYCLAWIGSGVVGIWASFNGDRAFAISVMTTLCALWAVGYVAQFLHDVFTGNLQSPAAYLGAVTYASFGAAVLRFPSKG